MQAKPLIIVGASARAAAESARRAGHAVYWLDLFGDVDVAATGPGRRVPAAQYPAALPRLIGAASFASSINTPFIYTGALENHPAVLALLAGRRRLLGNSSAVCRSLQDHQRIADCIRQHGLAVADVASPGAAELTTGRWLAKPVRGAGGLGIKDYKPGCHHTAVYLQRFICGASRSAVFISNGRACTLLGVSAQLVGLSALHAGRYNYCGSVGPLNISADEQANWQRLAEVLAREFDLIGLFGIDAIIAGDAVYLVEINPRYTASAEVYELAYGVSMVGLHVRACMGDDLKQALSLLNRPKPAAIAKGYLFAAADQVMPAAAQLRAGLGDAIQLADIPQPGERITAGQVMMSVLVRRADTEQAYKALLDAAAKIYRKL